MSWSVNFYKTSQWPWLRFPALIFCHHKARFFVCWNYCTVNSSRDTSFKVLLYSKKWFCKNGIVVGLPVYCLLIISISYVLCSQTGHVNSTSNISIKLGSVRRRSSISMTSAASALFSGLNPIEKGPGSGQVFAWLLFTLLKNECLDTKWWRVKSIFWV